jgi:alkaline phosphatase
VTTTTITHATPAGFAAVTPNRDDQNTIATQYLDLVDVALGGGRDHFDSAKRKDRVDLYDRYRQAGYAVCTTRDELRRAGRASKILGCFSHGHMPFSIDQVHRPEDHADVPTLAEMARTALEALGRGDDGFLLQIEGGRVDHAAHANDAAAMLHDQLAFDDAIGEVLAFVKDNPQTLVVITTDHGNANPGLNGMGSRYRDSTACFERIAGITASFATIHGDLVRAGGEDRSPSAEAVIEVVSAHAGFDLTADEAEAIARVTAGGRLEDLHKHHRGIVGALGQAFGNHIGIGWIGTAHTSNHAPTLAIGPGSDRFATLMHHTEVFAILTSLLGVRHTNPRMTAETARRFEALAPPPDGETVHWI